ncbi:MAG: type II toxin-antitoxin system RelB/DinJ family antitoxin [Bacteroides sp.]|nr:type II toxin-antitoxin system RelB/DinJ family antitoxin [Prevotella sp.]MCM1406868.1 type II toxin-antitoxin system RelB/DinJ family antitoxin [Treponema brennaborense]MCM1470895.1 type II toxin-antitoxin system RelB/DinJ family antitoxin [Bacteroides sp.]
MASSLVQVRVDESIRDEASEIFHNLGMDMSSAVRLFLNRVILAQGLPFPMRLQTEDHAEEMYEIPAAQPAPTFNPSEYLQSLIGKESEL